MRGNYKLGFFDFIYDEDGKIDHKKNWYQFTFNDHLHDASKTHCKNLVIGGYCMFYKKRSDIAYMATEDIMGYALRREDWFEHESNILYELSNSIKQTAMRKYYQQWCALKSAYFPIFIKWYRDQTGKPKLGVKIMGEEKEVYQKFEAFQKKMVAHIMDT